MHRPYRKNSGSTYPVTREQPCSCLQGRVSPTQEQGCSRHTHVPYVWPQFFHRACASHQATALMLKTRAQYVPWSPRQPPQTLNSTRGQACKGMLCTSTLTEPVKLATYFKNGNEVAGGSSQAHARCLACPQSRSLRVNGAPILVRGACRTRRCSQP